jgi:SAM-dependent methyltransferase
MKRTSCPGCYSPDINEFFVVKNAPVQSIVTIKSYEKAISIPRKDITLAFCNNCGFIFNSSFDTGIDHFTQGYEDQQIFSPTFQKFITEITNRFIEKYNVYEKDVIEIGCGKGDFINLICGLGNNRGTGIDPAYVEGRQKPNPNVSFIKEFYSEKHGELPADVITSRHTLEHIHETGEFVKIIRDSIKDDREITVLTEVPNVERILKIQAFWDIFYEHCSYFSGGSLARLFKLNGFEVIDVYTEYSNQYLFVEAKPAIQSDVETGNPHPNEEPVEELKKLAGGFVVKISRQLEEWKSLLLKLKSENKKVAIWGGGSKAVGFLTHFDELGVVKHVVDINPHIQGNYIPGIGKQYMPPEFLKQFQPDMVIIMNGIYEDEISKSLTEMNLSPDLICL